MTTHFSTDYANARRAFLAAAEARRFAVESFPIRERGPAGEELAIDAAYRGPQSIQRLLLVSSGVHGVEGYAGSAIQHQLLTEQLDGLRLPDDCGVLLIHAVNPYGFAHTRRVNESNVDLNRNFLRHPEEHAHNPGYDALHDVINHLHYDEEVEMQTRQRLFAVAQERGIPYVQFVLSSGQYKHPCGVQFGGTREEESNQHVRTILRRHHRGARSVAWLDLHTGLGIYGDYELVAQLHTDDPAYHLGRQWFGDKVRSTLEGESASPRLFGDMLDGAATEFESDATVVGMAPEFGTYDIMRVFQAMRADNWLHHHGDLDSEKGQGIKADLLEVFRPADATWQAAVLAGGARVIEQAARGLQHQKVSATDEHG